MALHSYLSFHCCKFNALSSAEEEKPLKHTRWMSGNFFVVPDRSSATPPSPGNESWMEGCWRGRPVSVISVEIRRQRVRQTQRRRRAGSVRHKRFNEGIRGRRQTTENGINLCISVKRTSSY